MSAKLAARWVFRWVRLWAPVGMVVRVVGVTLAGWAGPYDGALASGELQRPVPPYTAADHRALAPYLASPYFRDRN